MRLRVCAGGRIVVVDTPAAGDCALGALGAQAKGMVSSPASA